MASAGVVAGDSLLLRALPPLSKTGSTLKRAIWWVKRDARLADNEALARAVTEQDAVVPFFCVEPAVLHAPDSGHFHWHAQAQTIAALRDALRGRGSELWLGEGEIRQNLDALHRLYPFTVIYSHQETGAAVTYQRDLAVAEWCASRRVEWVECHQNGVIRRLSNRDQRQPIIRKRLYDTTVFTLPEPLQFPDELKPQCQRRAAILSKAWLPLPAWQRDLLHRPLALQQITETAAQKDLSSFLQQRGEGYSGGISSPNSAFHHGSRLSAHLAWGTLSLRQVFAATQQRMHQLKGHTDATAKQWRKSLAAFQKRLHWHDHFIQRLESAPNMETEPLNPAYRAVHYEDDEALLRAWLSGQTGFPLIDACMRCLHHTGFLNFRMRAMLVNFACFGLHLSWRTIQYPLAHLFLDYEPGIHFSQVQMQAGIVGINTVRVYSPQKQLMDQDPDAEFVRRWVPELAHASPVAIHHVAVRPISGYTAPVVDFKARSTTMKQQIFALRQMTETQAASETVLARHGSRASSTANRRKPKRKPATPSPQLSLF